ncbi:helix-turn-helix transcriptional regulator [Ktedonobacter sp. SOSP1-52]|uniref:LuxR C-terminal-related transcriptional regulator n=1 Tax=Ktedonobacter sp. SOSP1-52 TaxID=2778366 RepID=UPI0019165A24|nr:LuxR C-terminal-related transcriptional regulator [Ktedonobacter sp. SOSP1-52]GHO65155.1 helix-turn-helix transcriptional regulator [Ktedonobacter sp. SOSP1-52]
MPKRVIYLVHWSQEAQTYELSDGNSTLLYDLTAERPTWLAWLEDISSFAFRSRSGVHYTVRKERVQRNGPYWYGYRSCQGKTIKRYLGRMTDLSPAHLEDVAQRFTQAISSRVVDSTQPSSTPLSSPLLMSRFHPPRLPLALVERSHLFAKLDAWRSHQLTLVWAPAGFGKTTLVNSWLAERQAHRAIARTAWVSLEKNDNGPIHFWCSLIRACQTWHKEIGETALAHLRSTLQPPFASVPLRTILTTFLNDLATQEGPGILVLDEYHVITDSRLHEAMAFFLEHLPPQLHVVILTRSEPPFPLARWRAQGSMQEFAPADLRFSTLETATFLQHITGSAPSEQTIAHLETLLQGWPAGLRLLSLTGHMMPERVERYLTTLHGWQYLDSYRRQLLDYFVGEILTTQPEPLQRFLLQTSELPLLTGPLCDAVTGRQQSASLLETLERAGLFLEALDEAEAWYRYHSLWASAMRLEARRRLGEEALHTVAQQASHWYEQHARPGEAIEAALCSQDTERATQLIERFGASGQRYELHTLRGWLEQIPDAVVKAHPTLCLYAALTLQFQDGQIPPSHKEKEHIEALLQRAEDAWRQLGKLSWVGMIFAFRALNASLHPSSQQEAVEHATTALRFFADGDSDNDDGRVGTWEWRTICLGIVGSDALHQGRFEEAQRLLKEALTSSQERSSSQFLSEIYLRMGAVSTALGELHQAHAYYREALSSGHLQENSEDCVRALLGLAQLSLEWNDLKAAEQRISEALERTQKLGQEGNERVTYFLALLSAARGQEDAASLRLATLLARLHIASTQETEDLLPEALALQARLQLATGDHLVAQRTVTALANIAGTSYSFPQRMMVNILQARLQLAQGETNTAVCLLEQLLLMAQEKRYVHGQLEIQVLLALAQMACKQRDGARKWLRQALSQAHNEGFLRVFLAEGAPLARLLRSLLPSIREKAPRSFGQMLLRALTIPGGERTLSPSPFEQQPFEPLSPQEQRVLQFLVAGHTNQEIAKELVISVNTVKDHVKHLYRKLGVSNRLQAYEAAHHLKQL